MKMDAVKDAIEKAAEMTKDLAKPENLGNFDQVINNIRMKNMQKMMGRIEEVYARSDRLIAQRTKWRELREQQIKELAQIQRVLRENYEAGTISEELLTSLSKEQDRIGNEALKEVKARKDYYAEEATRANF